MNTTRQSRIPSAAFPGQPAQRLNLGAAVLSVALTTAVLGAVVFGMDATADSHVRTSAARTSVQAA